MSEKVLGFYEKDSTIHETRFGIWYEVHKNNLVPVVSVKELEKTAKNLEEWGLILPNEESVPNASELTYIDGIKDFINAVRKQVTKK